jgi:alkanesulfonate monooxygenase SsuD/methylene tetrahydromethanopterin reductase-like flavin-dependent oxidoreductase (luciferase family)
MKFSFFHLMPYTSLAEASGDWPVPNRVFDPETAHELYRAYIDTMIYAEQCGFDWIGCNEHHFSPYGLMANCNVIGGALAYPTKHVRIAMMGNLVPLNNPLRIAEEYAMLDCMSGGRLIAGLMRGIPHEYIAYKDAANAGRMQQRLQKREAATLEEQIAGGMIFCGSPQSVVRQMRRVHAELGNGVFNLTMQVGNLADAVVRRGMELFRDRVLPEVRDL